MKYVKSCLIITMLLGVGYSQCNESNWQEYYNSEGHNMVGCDLAGADLSYADLSGANLTNADLKLVDLQSVDFINTNCWGTFFVGANLEGTDFDGADLQYAYFDENEDYYDDVSYDAGAVSGDVNLDGELNILDLVSSANMILNP